MDEALFFKQYQKDLLKIANSEEGRFLLGFKGNEPIIKVTPESYHMPTGFGRDHKAVFFTDNRLGYKLGEPFQKLLLANNYQRVTNRRKAFLHYSNLETNYSKYPQIYLVTGGPFNPVSGGEGTLVRQDEATWAAARDATTADSVASNDEVQSTYTGNPSQFYLCYRVSQPFNTSSLTASALVKTPITYEAYRDDSEISGGNPFTNENSTTAELVVSSQSDPTNLTVNDFNDLTFVSKGSFALASTSNGAYFSISISDTTVIQNQGYTKLYVITGLDLNNTSPGSGATRKQNILAWQKESQANPPKLTVTYDPVGAALFFGLAM